ncbi:hypothetical protein M9Y10_028593 [Tritrichomonas musculus]|uniref:Serine/threonine-protein phosphatase n=1 Tax=Tritrichomonas musculus TaxID=1915356 RepID=A0ABR2KJS9_9EUKA
MSEVLDFKDITEKLHKGKVIDEKIVQDICMKLMEILHQEDNLLILQSPIIVVGDIHGQYEDLRKMFEEVAKGYDQKFLFMGDYVDRGYFSLNTFLLLAVLKLQYPNSYFLLRGNHECRQITRTYGFYNEIIVNYGNTSIWSRVMDVFDLLPLCALIDNDIFSVHGGLSPSVPLISLINDIDRKKDIPAEGPISDLLWGDPAVDKNVEWKQNDRGAGFLFGAKPTAQFCHVNRLRLITRSHQLARDGYQYFFKDMTKIPEGRLLLVWSAPNYGYTSNNDASILKLEGTNQKDKYNILIFDESAERLPRDHDITTSPYFA